jgi:hypothetical protein
MFVLAVVLGCGPSPESQPPPAVPSSAGEESAESTDSSSTMAATGVSEDLPERLNVDHIAPVVARARPRVKAKCWQPALNARSPDAPANARIVVSLVIDASGTVTSAEADDAGRHYPGLSSCVSGVVRSLRFPQAANPTPVNIPFVFAAQG